MGWADTADATVRFRLPSNDQSGVLSAQFRSQSPSLTKIIKVHKAHFLVKGKFQHFGRLRGNLLGRAYKEHPTPLQLQLHTEFGNDWVTVYQPFSGQQTSRWAVCTG